MAARQTQSVMPHARAHTYTHTHARTHNTSVHYRCFVLNINATWNVKLQESQQCLELGVLYNIAAYFYRCTVHFDIHTVHLPTNEHLLTLC